ncbi:dihydroorotase [Dunaliella salina]|uniref:dihydroorotase n=1 Tax=Dunaliella salina TaxID=3046 RepID=A0ABQ7G968_DUNSA|nr:dihydroorotase [Dunaliella salina]|eukprot:KAF5831142.1 dihydroorotase [Dunaliella salina]
MLSHNIPPSLCAGSCPLTNHQLPRALFSAHESRRPSCSSNPAASIQSPNSTAPSTSLTITAPDDWHLHVRDGKAMASVVPHTAQHYRRAIIMPNLTPPVTTAQAAIDYRQRILACVPPSRAPFFQPLMTCYLTDRTTPDEVEAAKEAGVVAYKLYPAGATTNSDSGVTDILKVVDTLKHMANIGMPLLMHGEVTDPSVDMFDREAVFIHTKLIPLLDQVPNLKVVMEHITTKDAAEFVASAPPNIAATVTPQHMLLNRNALFAKGLRPHNFCLPILKREKHREAVAEKATSGSPKFFLGTDSAPHPKGAKESSCGCAGMYTAPISLGLYATAFEAAGRLSNLEAFASFNGPGFYGLPPNEGKVTLVKQPLLVPDHYSFGEGVVVPMWAGEEISWQVAA